MTPAERRDAIAGFMRPLASVGRRPDTWDEARPRLRPAVRAAGFLGGIGGEARPATWPVAPFLVGLLAIDLDGAMTFATADELGGWGVDLAEARDAAVDNLAAGGLALTATDVTDMWRIAGPDSYESSWLALPERLHRALADHLPGETLVLAPARGTVLLVDADMPHAVAQALARAETAYRELPRPLSPVAYRMTGQGLDEWCPPDDHPCTIAVQRARRQLAVTEYQDQCHHLQELMDRAGEELFVAHLGAAERPDGTVATWATWPLEVPCTLLPQADYLAIAVGDDDHFFVTWDDAIAEAGGSLVEEPEWGLPRWRATGGPPADAVQRLRDRATDL